MIVEAEKAHDLLVVRWRLRRASAAAPAQVCRFEKEKCDGVNPN